MLPKRQLLISTLLSVLLVGCTPTDQKSPEFPETCLFGATENDQFVLVPSGSFMKGDSAVYPEELPSLRLQVPGFAIQKHEVTNRQFAEFIEETGYETDAEKSVAAVRTDAGSAVFQQPISASKHETAWTLVPGADWKHPLGPGSSIENKGSYPVVHVSRRDAEAYAVWAGGRLPSEVEWEYAASLGLPDPDDPVSGAYSGAKPRGNTWQGIFPLVDRGTDGFKGIAPVGCFPKDRIGLYDMIGNVWEWTDTPFAEGTSTLKGGSYLCADNFCRRYRPAARQPQENEFSSNHIGFRIVLDPPLKSEPTR